MTFYINENSLSPEEYTIVKRYSKNKRELYKLTTKTKEFFENINNQNEQEILFVFNEYLQSKIYDISMPNRLLMYVFYNKLFNKLQLTISKHLLRHFNNIRQHTSIILPDPLLINEVHMKSKGKNIKLGMIDTGFDNNKIDASYDFIGNNSNENHGKNTSLILRFMCPDSNIIAFKVGKYRNDKFDLLCLLGIIGSVVKGCNILNISLDINTNTSFNKRLFQNVISKINNNFNLYIITTAGNTGRKIRDNRISNFDEITTVSGYNKDKSIWKDSGTGDCIDVFMPVWCGSDEGTSYSSAYFSGIIGNYYSYTFKNILHPKTIINMYKTPLTDLTKYTIDISKMF